MEQRHHHASGDEEQDRFLVGAGVNVRIDSGKLWARILGVAGGTRRRIPGTDHGRCRRPGATTFAR